MDRERVEITTRQQWREWLTEHHASSDGVWVVFPKQGIGGGLTLEELVLESLCFGWIDSQARGVDEDRTSITMTPRRAGSRWTQRNRDRVQRLEVAGLMAPAGREAVVRARESGAWDELREVEALVEPPDLRAALEADPDAHERWHALSRSARFQHLLRLHDTKRAATRERRIAEMLAP